MEILSLINTPFKEKFGTPRQPLLITRAQGVMRFPKNDFFMEAFRGIEAFTHLWLIFEFHQVRSDNIKALIRPPRFGGAKKLGVFASRSPHRPNRLGMSVVKFESLEIFDHEVVLTVSGVDMVDGTPIVDIKPYLPYADAVMEAKAQDFLQPERLTVEWQCPKPVGAELIEECLGMDHRPHSKKDEGEEFGLKLLDVNIRFQVEDSRVIILSIKKLEKL